MCLIYQGSPVESQSILWLMHARFDRLLHGPFLLLLGLHFLTGQLSAADDPPSAQAILSKTGVQGGLCVVVGESGFPIAEQLVRRSSFLVHLLVSDPAKAESARAKAQASGFAGQLTVEFGPSGSLPHADDLVNALVVCAPETLSEDKLRRVLAPRGIAWIERGGAWSVLLEPWPAGFDEWSHWRHGADGNMVSHDHALTLPTGLRWVAGPAQDAGGKKWYHDHVLVSAGGRNFYVFESEIVARDAFNGLLLWRRPLQAHTFRETGGPVPEFLRSQVREAVRVSKVRPAAVGERLYVAAEGGLSALHAATGATLAEFGAVSDPREVLVENGVLVLSEQNRLRAWRLSSPSLLWETAGGAERIVAGDGRLFSLANDLLVCRDLESGQERWRVQDPDFVPATTCTYHQGRIALELSSWRDDPEGCGILVYDTENGQLLWRKQFRPGMTHWREARSFFAQDLLWLQTEPSRIVGFDLSRGEIQKVWRTRGLHCATPIATERYFIAPECEFTDWQDGSQLQARMFKSACRLPFIPANGLLYSFPVQCECYPMLRGYMGLTATDLPKVGVPPLAQWRDNPGPTPAPVQLPDPAQEWPIYRHDIFRSGTTPMQLIGPCTNRLWSAAVTAPPKSALAGEWKENPFVRGIITPPVIAAGRVVVALPDEHRVVGLDATNGQSQWSFIAGGRIDTPPTLHGNRCLFGSHDGSVYCLETATGSLLWRFVAAPKPTRITAYGQLESTWPVPGSVLVDDDVAYFPAGRHPRADGGVWVYALRIQTADVLWQKAVQELPLESWYGALLPGQAQQNRQKVGLDFEPVDLLVKDGETVSMSRWQFHPLTGDWKLELGSTRYQTPGLAVPRGLWGYGIRQNKSVDPKPPAVFDQTGLHSAANGDVALLMAGGTLVTARSNGDVQVAERILPVGTPVVHDGLAAAYGRLYLSTADGQVLCLE